MKQSYDHAIKAGNRGDVWKHYCLLTVADALSRRSGACFKYLDSHCGRGLYVLPESGEWREGIGKAAYFQKTYFSHPYFATYGKRVDPGTIYFASWLLVALHLQREGRHFQMSVYDTSPEVKIHMQELGLGASRNPGICYQSVDGYEFLHSADLDSIDLVLLDPPYYPLAKADWRAARSTVPRLNSSGVSYLIWYPVYWPTNPDSLVTAAGAPGFEIHWRPMGPKASQVQKGCGVLAGGDSEEILNSHVEQLSDLAAALGGELSIRKRP